MRALHPLWLLPLAALAFGTGCPATSNPGGEVPDGGHPQPVVDGGNGDGGQPDPDGGMPDGGPVSLELTDFAQDLVLNKTSDITPPVTTEDKNLVDSARPNSFPASFFQ